MSALEKEPSEGSVSLVPGRPGKVSMENLIGIRTIDINGFSADFLRGDAVRGQTEFLLPITTRIDATVFKKKFSEAEEASQRKYDLMDAYLDNPNSTSMVLYRKKGASIGDYHGYSFQQELELQTSRGTEVVLYWVTRAFENGFRDKKLGRFDMQQGLVRHENADAILHRTINPASPWSVHESRIVNERLYFPWAWASLYGVSPEARRAQEMMFGGFFKLREVGIAKAKNPPSYAAGVAIADEGPNLAYEPKEGHKPTQEIIEYIKTKLKADPARGDRVYSVGLVDSE